MKGETLIGRHDMRLRHGYNNETELAGGVVRKRYRGEWPPRPRFDAETRALDALQNHLPVPRVVSRDPGNLEVTLQFVAGLNGQDLISRGEADAVLASLGTLGRELHNLPRDIVALVADGDGEALLHGDFGPQNAVFDPDTFEVRALVDWEWCHIGPAVEDLAWCEWIVRSHHPESARSVEVFYDAYGERPAWEIRHAVMVGRCAEILGAMETDADKDRWRGRLEATQRFEEL
jgi:tRNA A-37 threonylcarbamoyl transferase component Bud32